MAISKDICKVQKIETKGDALVVASARVSFAKDYVEFDPQVDERLIKYLIRHDHWSPASHPHTQFVFARPIPNEILNELVLSPIHGLSWGSTRGFPFGPVDYVSGSYWGLLNLGRRYSVDGLFEELEKEAPLLVNNYKEIYGSTSWVRKYIGKVYKAAPLLGDEVTTVAIEAPLALARQLFKHQVGFTFSERMAWNEVSGRYVDLSSFDTYKPTKFHAQAENKKQGVDLEEPWNEVHYYDRNTTAIVLYDDLVRMIEGWYQANKGMGNEERRLLLPAAKKTSWYWTARKKDWDRVFRLRLDEHAQFGTQEVVKEIKRVIEND